MSAEAFDRAQEVWIVLQGKHLKSLGQNSITTKIPTNSLIEELAGLSAYRQPHERSPLIQMMRLLKAVSEDGAGCVRVNYNPGIVRMNIRGLPEPISENPTLNRIRKSGVFLEVTSKGQSRIIAHSNCIVIGNQNAAAVINKGIGEFPANYRDGIVDRLIEGIGKGLVRGVRLPNLRDFQRIA